MTQADIGELMYRAHWAQSRIDEHELTAKREHELVELTAKIDRAKIEENLRNQTASDRRVIAEVSEQCRQWMADRLKTLHKSDKKSVSLAFGDIASVTRSASFKVTDPEALFEWARQKGYVREIPAIPAETVTDWATLRRDLEAVERLEGEVVPLLKNGDPNPVPGVEAAKPDPEITVTIRGDD